MTLEFIRSVCLGFPHVTEQVLWGDNLVFKAGGRMFAIASLEADRGEAGRGGAVAFRCTPEEFAGLIEYQGIVPAPYLARAHWVSLKKFDILSGIQLSRRLRDSYDLALAGLSRRARAALEGAPVTRQQRQRLKAQSAPSLPKKSGNPKKAKC